MPSAERVTGAAPGLRRGFDHHTTAYGERREHGPGGYRHREVPGRGDHGQARRYKSRSGHTLDIEGPFGVVVGEIDRFADLHVGFGDRFAGLDRHHFDQTPAECRDDIAHVVQHPRPLAGGQRTPGISGTRGDLDEPVESVRAGHPCHGDGRAADR